MDRGQISNNDGNFKSVSVKQNLYVRNKITADCINTIHANFAYIDTDRGVTIAGDLFVKSDTTLAGDLFVSGDTTLDSNVFIGGNTTLNGDLLVSGSTTIQTDLNVAGNTVLDGQLFVGGAATLNNTLFVSGNTTLQSDLLVQGSTTIEHSLYVSGNTTLHGGLLVQGDTSLAEDLHVSGNTELVGNLFVKQDVTIAGNLFVSGTATINNLAVSGAATLAALKVVGDSTLCGNLVVEGDARLEQNLTVLGYSELHNLTVSGSTTLAELKVVGNSTLCGQLTVEGDSTLRNDLFVKGDSTLAQDLFVSGETVLQGHVKAVGDVSLCSNVDVAGLLKPNRLKVLQGATMCSDLFVAGTSHMNRIVPYSGITISIGDVPGSNPKPVLATNILAVREIRGIGIGAPVTIGTSVNVLGKITATEAVISPLFCASTTIGAGNSLLQTNRITPKTGATMSVGTPGGTISIKDDLIVRGMMLVDTILPKVGSPTLVIGEAGDTVCINADSLQALSIENKPGMTMAFCSQKILTDKIVAKSGGSLTLINPHVGMDIEVLYTNRGNLVMGAQSNIARGGRSGVFAGQGLTATGEDSVVIGGLNSRSHGLASGVFAGQDLKARGDRSVALGGINNLLTNSIQPFEYASRDSGILVGRDHTITAEMGVILGGCKNRVDSAKGAILGGNNIRVCGFSDAAVGGGTLYSDSRNAVLVGGTNNTLFGADNSVICGGSLNQCSGMTNNMVIAGGVRNRITGRRSGIVGGTSLVVRAEDSVCCGGTDNRIRKNKARSFIGGGLSLVNFGDDTGMVGGCFNRVDEGTCGFLGGGRSNTLIGHDGAICGGRMVRVSGTRCGGMGGDGNTIAGLNSVMIGGRDSRLSQMANHSAMAGGTANKMYRGENSFIAGGANHSVTNSIGHSAIVVGQGITVDSAYSAGVAGQGNYVSGTRGFVAGGQDLKLHSGTDSALVAGFSSQVRGNNTVILGGQTHTSRGNNNAMAGGIGNAITQSRSAIIGGNSHEVVESLSGTGFDSGVFVGNNNHITDGSQAVIAGGLNNVSTATDCFMGGSESCTATAIKCIVIGSITSTAQGTQCGVYNSMGSKAKNGTRNVIMASENSRMETSLLLGNSVLAGGCNHKMIGTTDKSVLLGGMGHTLNNSLQCGIMGGQRTQMRGLDNIVLGGQDLRIKSSEVEVSALLAGRRNKINNDQEESVIVGGRDCIIQDNSRTNIIEGAESAIIRTGSLRSGIMSGLRQTIRSSENSDIIGGKDNLIDNSDNTVIVGGCNQSSTGTGLSTMIGGNNNTVSNGVASSGNAIITSNDSNIDGEGTRLVILASDNSSIEGDTSQDVRVMGSNIDVADSQEIVAMGQNMNITSSNNVVAQGSDLDVNGSDNVYLLGNDMSVSSNSSNIAAVGRDFIFTREPDGVVLLGDSITADNVTNALGINIRPDMPLTMDTDNEIQVHAGEDGTIKMTGITQVRTNGTTGECDDFDTGYPLRIGGIGDNNINGLAIMVDWDADPDPLAGPAYGFKYVSFFSNQGGTVGNIHGESQIELRTLNPVYIQYIIYEAALIVYNGLLIAYHVCARNCVVDPCIASCDNLLAGADAIIETADLAFNTFWLAYLSLNRGVVYNSGGCDYAEYVLKENPNEPILGGNVVGIYNGRVTRNTSKCTSGQFFLVSTTPIVVGNHYGDDIEKKDKMVLIAMMGQVKTQVHGVVHSGDYIIPSGRNDGSVIAVSPAQITTKQLQQVVGVVWEVEMAVAGFSVVTVAVGINQNHTAQRLQQLEDRLDRMEQKLNQLTGGDTVRSRDVDDQEAAEAEDADQDVEDITEADVKDALDEIIETSVLARDEWEKRQDRMRENVLQYFPERFEKMSELYEEKGHNYSYELLMNMNSVRNQAYEDYVKVIQSNKDSIFGQALARINGNQ